MDFSKYTIEELQGMLTELQGQQRNGRQKTNFDAALKSEREAMMAERGGFENFAAGVGKAAVDTGRGLSQFLPESWGGMSREQVDEAKRLDAPLMDTGWGTAGNVVGNIGASLAPLGAARALSAMPAAASVLSRLPGANTIVGGAALGGGMGAIQPVGTDDSRALNSALGTVLGGALPAAVTAGRTAKAALWDPLTDSGRDSIAARLLFKDKTPAEAAALAAKLQGAREVVPGSRPTAAQATLDPTIMSMEAAMRNEAGPMQTAISSRLMEQHAARQKFLETLAGTPEELGRIRDARGAAFRAGQQALQEIPADVPTSRTINLIDRILASPNAESDSLKGALTNLRGKFFEPYPAGERLSNAAKMLADATNRAGTRGINTQDFKALEQARAAVIGANRAAARLSPAKHDQLVEAALQRMEGLTVRTKTAQSALDEATALLSADNTAFKSDPARLMGIYREINQIRSGLKRDGADMPTLKALDAIKRSLGNAIDRGTKDALPGGAKRFKDLQRDYAKASQEMDARTTLQYLQNRSSGAARPVLDASGDLADEIRPIQASKFLNLTEPANQRATVAGATKKARPGDFARELRPDQLSGVDALRFDLMRANAAANPIAANGSQTARNLITANFIEQALGSTGLPNAFGPSVTRMLTETPFIGAGWNALTRAADGPTKEHLARLLMDPQRLGALASSRASAQQGLPARILPSVSRLLPPALVGGGFGMFGTRTPPEPDGQGYGQRW